MIMHRPADLPAQRPQADADDGLNKFMTTCATTVIMAALHRVGFTTARGEADNVFDLELFDQPFRITVDCHPIATEAEVSP
jgi:hypothetical protein